MSSQNRHTRQKNAIRSAFLEANRPLSPDEILQEAQQQVGSLSVATVYRNVALLVAENWLVPVLLAGEGTRYELAGKAHHHHFRCTTCNKVFELPGCAVQLTDKHLEGFRATGHELLVYGVCHSCD